MSLLRSTNCLSAASAASDGLPGLHKSEILPSSSRCTSKVPQSLCWDAEVLGNGILDFVAVHANVRSLRSGSTAKPPTIESIAKNVEKSLCFPTNLVT
jgi:hypothetical protein